MTPQQRKWVASLAEALASSFDKGRPYSYRLQEAEDQDGKRTTVFLRVTYEDPVPFTPVPPKEEIVEGILVTWTDKRILPLVMRAIRKARNGWDGWLCTWTTDSGIVLTAWHATKDLEVVK